MSSVVRTNGLISRMSGVRFSLSSPSEHKLTGKNFCLISGSHRFKSDLPHHGDVAQLGRVAACEAEGRLQIAPSPYGYVGLAEWLCTCLQSKQWVFNSLAPLICSYDVSDSIAVLQTVWCGATPHSCTRGISSIWPEHLPPEQGVGIQIPHTPPSSSINSFCIRCLLFLFFIQALPLTA